MPKMQPNQGNNKGEKIVSTTSSTWQLQYAWVYAYAALIQALSHCIISQGPRVLKTHSRQQNTLLGKLVRTCSKH